MFIVIVTTVKVQTMGFAGQQTPGLLLTFQNKLDGGRQAAAKGEKPSSLPTHIILLAGNRASSCHTLFFSYYFEMLTLGRNNAHTTRVSSTCGYSLFNKDQTILGECPSRLRCVTCKQCMLLQQNPGHTFLE